MIDDVGDVHFKTELPRMMSAPSYASRVRMYDAPAYLFSSILLINLFSVNLNFLFFSRYEEIRNSGEEIYS